jgi:hypothetical protein
VFLQWVSARLQWDGLLYLKSIDYGFGWCASQPQTDVVFYRADGRGGQYILVIPAWDMPLVITGGGYEFPQIEDYLAASIQDLGHPLPANPDGATKLSAALEEIGRPPAAREVAPLPQAATAVSGKTFAFDPNPLQIRSMRLDFNTPDVAVFQLEIKGEPLLRSVQVGLDGRYRNSTDGRPVLARGGWQEDGTFKLEYNEGPGQTVYTMTLRVDGDGVVLELRDAWGQEQLIEGVLKK